MRQLSLFLACLLAWGAAHAAPPQVHDLASGFARFWERTQDSAPAEQELLLDFPAGMPARTRAVLPAALVQLEQVLGSSDALAWGGQFHSRTDDGTGLPGRRGYYLGYLVAEAAARRHSLQALAALDCAASRALVRSTVQALRSQAALPRQQ